MCLRRRDPMVDLDRAHSKGLEMTFQKTKAPPQSNGMEPDDPALTKPAASSALRVPESPPADVESGGDADVTPQPNVEAAEADRKSMIEIDDRRGPSQRRS